jgi:tRNA-binding protein
LESIIHAPVKPTITPAALDRLDVRVGTIVAVADITESSDLVRLTVDFGDHRRQVLVGMKGERDDPAEVEGLQALFVVNLAPRDMFGHTSEAMLFDIGYPDGLKPALAVPERQVPNGCRAG